MDLIPLNMRRAFIQIVIGFAVYALWRAIRLGRPVTEAQPVNVAGTTAAAAGCTDGVGAGGVAR